MQGSIHDILAGDYWDILKPKKLCFDRSPYGRRVRREPIIAFDINSVRSYDKDGRLHIATANISKSNICPYQGQEIPNADELDLDPNQIYQLFRAPEELQRACPTFNNLPILSEHVPVTAEEHDFDATIGATGGEARFEMPYLKNSLVIWPKAAIDGIESGRKREISSAYHYRMDPTPGVFQGQRYQGVMRDIVGNHCAIVETGRAGQDVIVGDAMPNFNTVAVTFPSKPVQKRFTVIVGKHHLTTNNRQRAMEVADHYKTSIIAR
jgi:hypothetical protein